MKYSYNDIMEPWYPEEFITISFYPIKQNMYAISNYGNIINIKRNKELSIFKGAGYSHVALQNEDNTRSTYYVHILVAHHFIPKTEDDILNNRIFVNHKNLIRSMNYVHNLEWVNDAENNKHSYEFRDLKLKTDVVTRLKTETWGTMLTYGEKNGMARLTEKQVNEICKLAEEGGHTRYEICKLVGLEGNQNDINILRSIIGKYRWKHVSCNYNLPNIKDIPIK